MYRNNNSSTTLSVRITSLFLLFFLFFFKFSSCDEATNIGLELEPPDGRFVTRTYTDNAIKSQVIALDSVAAMNTALSLLGELNDPLFGKTKAGFMSQVGILYINHDFGLFPNVDSLFLHLYVEEIYGNNLAPQEIKVYEVIDTLDRGKYYYSNYDFTPMVNTSSPLATYTYQPSKDQQIISIPITNINFRSKLLNAPESAKETVAGFQDYFRGIYVTSERKGETGAIFTLNLNHEDSRISIYYQNAVIPDSSFRYDYIIASSYKKINFLSHDYQDAVFKDLIDQPETQDTVFYIQGAGGVMARLDFDDLEMWRDSLVNINSARLILPLESMDRTADMFSPPNRMVVYEVGEDGLLYTIIDQSLGEEYYGGNFDDQYYQYNVNITNYLQEYLKGTKSGTTLFVDVLNSGRHPNRGVIKNSNHPDGGLRLEITYSKY